MEDSGRDVQSAGQKESDTEHVGARDARETISPSAVAESACGDMEAVVRRGAGKSEPGDMERGVRMDVGTVGAVVVEDGGEPGSGRGCRTR